MDKFVFATFLIVFIKIALNCVGLIISLCIYISFISSFAFFLFSVNWNYLYRLYNISVIIVYLGARCSVILFSLMCYKNSIMSPSKKCASKEI